MRNSSEMKLSIDTDYWYNTAYVMFLRAHTAAVPSFFTSFFYLENYDNLTKSRYILGFSNSGRLKKCFYMEHLCNLWKIYRDLRSDFLLD